MNVNEPLINQKGPISQIAPVGLTPLVTGPALFCFSGSAYATSPNAWIGIDLTLDGRVIGTASVFCNEDQSHRALVLRFIETYLYSQCSAMLRAWLENRLDPS